MKTEWNPGKLLEMSGSYWQTCTLHAAVKLDIFSAVAEKQMSSADIAAKISADEDALTRLLNALCAMDLLCKKEEKFAFCPLQT